jgi:hypothetical protein
VINEARQAQDRARDEQERTRDKLSDMIKEGGDILVKQKQSQFDQEKNLFTLQRSVEEKLHDAEQKLSQLDQLHVRLESAVRDAEEVGSLLQELQDPAAKPLAAEIPTASSTSRANQRSKEDLIREVIKTSKFEWTTIGRVMKGTGLSHDEIMELTKAMQDIRIGWGRKSEDHIFRFKRNDES